VIVALFAEPGQDSSCRMCRSSKVLVSMRDTQKHLSGQNTCDSLGKTLAKREEEILVTFMLKMIFVVLLPEKRGWLQVHSFLYDS
jgi:hypothetical protein